MAGQRLLVETDTNGVSEYAHFDDDGELIGVERTDDVESVLEENKRKTNEGNRGFGKSREWKFDGSIPPVVLLKWATDSGVPPHKAMSNEFFKHCIKKYRRDPDYQYIWVN